jgi:hypothetical protein
MADAFVIVWPPIYIIHVDKCSGMYNQDFSNLTPWGMNEQTRFL